MENQAKYILKSHADFAKDISGRTMFYQIFNAAGLQCGEFSGSPESAIEYAKVQGLEFIAPADLLHIWRAKETPPPARVFCAQTARQNGKSSMVHNVRALQAEKSAKEGRNDR